MPQTSTTKSTDEHQETVIFANGSLPETAESSLDALQGRCQHLVFRCQSGRRIEGDWTGIPIEELLTAVDVPDATTHLLVESADGYRACVAVRDAMDALLAFEEDRVDCTTTGGVTPRFVGPHIETRRQVKCVDTIQAISLRPGEDAIEYEFLPE